MFWDEVVDNARAEKVRLLYHGDDPAPDYVVVEAMSRPDVRLLWVGQ